MKNTLNKLQLLTLFLLGTFIFGTQVEARVRNDMPSMCKYEAARHYGIRQSAVRTRSVERVGNRFVVYGQTPKNTRRALFFKCTFDRRGEYRGIKKTRDTRYANGGGHGNAYVPKTVKRVCKGEASARWRMRPREIRIDKVKRLGRKDYMVTLRGRNYRGKCEVSQSGHIYQFRTRSAGNNVNNHTPQSAVRSCKRRAASRWGTRPSNIRVNYTKRLGRDDYIIKLSSRYDRAECEVSRRGRIYLFSEY